MGKWGTIDNLPPSKRNIYLEMIGSVDKVAERILTDYIETGRSVRALARKYRCGKSTVHRYIKQYSRNCVPYSMYQKGCERAYMNSTSGSEDMDDFCSLD